MYDVSFQLEHFEFLTFITTNQNYQFVSCLNKMMGITLKNIGATTLNVKKKESLCVIFTYYNEVSNLLYILVDIKDNSLGKPLQYYDKLLLINGDYNKSVPAKTIETQYNPLLSDTLDCKRWLFDAETNAKDKQLTDSLRLVIEGKNQEGLLKQIERYLKDNMAQENETPDEQDVFYF